MTLRQIELMIVGAQKAGTSSLHQYLAQHSGIRTHAQREITYFINDDEFKRGYEKAFERYFSPQYTDQKTILGKSVGIMYLPVAIERLYAHNASVQLVVCLRNPIQRAYSAFWYARRMGWEYLESFDEALEADLDRFGDDWIKRRNCSYLERSRYAEHLKKIYQIFPGEQVQVLLTEDMKADAHGVCNQIFAKAGLPALDRMDVERKHNAVANARSPFFAQLLSRRSFFKTAARRLLPDTVTDQVKSKIRRFNEEEFTHPPLSLDTFNRLTRYFQPYNQELGTLLGRDLTHWNAGK